MAEEEGAGDGGEKTHEPTQQKLDEARRKGDVAKSVDVATAAAYLGLLAALVAVGPEAVERSAAGLAGMLGHVDRLEGRLLGPGGGALSAALMAEVLAPLAPLALAPLVAVLAAYAAQRAIVVAPEKLAPKLSRISPIANAKNKFGPTGLFEFAKSTVKLIAISIVLAVFLLAETDRISALLRLDPRAAGPEMARLGVGLMAVVSVVAVIVAAADFAWQRFDHARKLRMSLQEMKEEHKRSEGDPHLKGERRRRAQAIATNKMLVDVPKADVVVVNPTHFAVALQWSRKPGTAPVCVAKGVDEIALAIRARAAEAGVPIREDAPTARALHATVEIGQEIGREHYRAVAAAIRWAETMRQLARARGWGRSAP